MKIEQKEALKLLIMRVGFVVVFLGTAILHYSSVCLPIASDKYHSFRTSETAIVIQDFFRNGVSLFHYSMPLFGKPWNVMFEFPTYQALVYGVMRLLGATNIDLWARLVSVIIFYTCAVILVCFTSYITDKVNAYCVGIVFLLSAYNLYWSNAVLIDYLSVLFALVYLICLCICVDKANFMAVVAGLSVGILGYMTKGTSFIPVVVLAACYILYHEVSEFFSTRDRFFNLLRGYLKNNHKRLIYIAILSLVPAFCGLLWTKYADGLKNMSPYAEWLSSNNVSEWYYGTLQQKISPSYWSVIFSRYECLFGNRWVLLTVTVIYFIFSERKYWKIVVVSFVAQFATVFILFNLFFVHNYYLIELVPFAYLMFGTMLYEIFQVETKFAIAKRAVCLVAVYVLIYFQIEFNGEYIHETLKIAEDGKVFGAYLSNITDADELIVVLDQDWSPLTLYEANRRGFMVRDNSMLYDEKFRTFLGDDNYTTYVTSSADGIEAICDLNCDVEQYVMDSSFKDYEKVYVFKHTEVNDKADAYSHEIRAYDGVQQVVGEVSDGNIFTIKYKVDDTLGTHGYIIDKDNEVHDFVIILPSNETIARVNFKQICSEPVGIIIDGSEKFNISYVY